MDLAIVGEGFSRLSADGSYAYTQGGNFSLDAEGNLTLLEDTDRTRHIFKEREDEIDLLTLTISPNGTIFAYPLAGGEGEEYLAPEEEGPARRGG